MIKKGMELYESPEFRKSIFFEHANRRKFSESLAERSWRVLNRSFREGDGGLWTDSLFVDILEDPNSPLSRSFSEFLGVRGDFFKTSRFTETLTTQYKTLNYTFQSPIEEAISQFNFDYPHLEITEERLIKIELQEALSNYEDASFKIRNYVIELIEPLLEIRPQNHAEETLRILVKVNSFQKKMINAFLLSNMVGIHPFDVFYTEEELKNRNEKRNVIRDFKCFLIYLRDSLNISSSVIPNTILERIATTWDERRYVDISHDCKDENINNISEKYHHACYYVASELIKNGGALSILVDFLEEPKASEQLGYNEWNENEGILLILERGKIKVQPFDLLGTKIISTDSFNSNLKATCGLTCPNPIWNETVIDNLEFLIDKNPKEKDLQLFLEMYPDFILEDLQISLFPQIVLFNKYGRNLRPDFVVKRRNSSFIDIVEIKRPVKKLITGEKDRPIFTRQVAKGIAQLKMYGDWFKSPQNQEWFRKKYGLEGFEPKLSLVIGRRGAFVNERIKAQVMKGSGVNILTYGDLVDLARIRRNKIFS